MKRIVLYTLFIFIACEYASAIKDTVPVTERKMRFIVSAGYNHLFFLGNRFYSIYSVSPTVGYWSQGKYLIAKNKNAHGANINFLVQYKVKRIYLDCGLEVSYYKIINEYLSTNIKNSNNSIADYSRTDMIKTALPVGISIPNNCFMFSIFMKLYYTPFYQQRTIYEDKSSGSLYKANRIDMLYVSPIVYWRPTKSKSVMIYVETDIDINKRKIKGYTIAAITGIAFVL